MDLIRSYPWLVGFALLVAAAFLGALLWKILRSEEGFLFGYGDWVVGKWGAGDGEDDEDASEPKPRARGKSQVQAMTQQQPPTHQEPRRDFQAMRKALQNKETVLTLLRLLDGDLAYLMMHDAGEWEPKILRALQTLISGVTRVIHPAGRCRCAFFILSDDEKHLVLAVGEGYPGLRRKELALDHSCAGRAFLTGDQYYCRDITTDPVYWHSQKGNRDFRSIACVPVRAGQNVFGVICLDAERPDAFSADDFAHLEVLAAKMAVFCAFHALQVSVCTVGQGGG